MESVAKKKLFPQKRKKGLNEVKGKQSNLGDGKIEGRSKRDSRFATIWIEGVGLK
jgi:hypothetical protein